MNAPHSQLPSRFRCAARSAGASRAQGRFTGALLRTIALAAVSASPLAATDWPQWRGPWQTGYSEATGLISSWSRAGENLIWRQDFIGRSTPVVLDGRVFATGRGGEGITRRELVAAFDARSGERLWEREIPTAQTTVPYNRAGWASPAADRDTGYVYVQGIAGPLICFDRDGNVVWEYDLKDEFGRYSGYGGRTHAPLVEGDLLIVNVINSSWGRLGPPRHRYFAFDKRTGEVVWISTPGGEVHDLNTASNGIVGVVNGRRLYIAGNGDGYLYALDVLTGRPVWSFRLSKRAINSSPVLIDDTVYAGHSEENIDEATLGRVVAIDATGSGDVTATHEKWRREITMGFPSPLVHEGRVYLMDNAANFYALDAQTGETRWEIKLGTVGKSAPVWADGRIYATELNGRLWILKPGDESAEVLDEDLVEVEAEGRYAEIYGSPAIAYGRVYFTTEEGIYALGDRNAPFEVTASADPDDTVLAGSGPPATLLLVPADVTIGLVDNVEYEVRAFDAAGRPLGPVEGEWSLDGLQGGIRPPGILALEGSAPQAGEVVFESGALEARGRVRGFPPLPLEEDFDSIQGRGRPWWLGLGRYQVVEQDGGKVLEKPVAPSGLLRSDLIVGPPGLRDYTVQIDFKATQAGRRRPDAGLINQGYILDLKGIKQELEVRSWQAVLRMATQVPFEWEMDAWYTMKLRVDQRPDSALVRGKVWRRSEPEPEAWTISVEDPQPSRAGAPGVQGYSPASIFYDNLKVTVNP
ncbi:MAG TPA: PQQ-binding-like beta-propeller repeat protein [Thermoanaerobaculia bacterium]|nr:PQQ-binding-like beta-propeller repeat protein [Thermoanaerobaculia bacterium]